jgi:hypothetical protein
MFGIGLGAAASGFERGYGLGQQFRADRKARKNEQEINAVDTEGKTQFDADVAAGKAKPDDWDSFYTSYVVPKKAATLRQQGDLQGATAWQSWADSDSARRGSKLFASGMLKGQAGDMTGAIKDFVQAGKIKGYGGDYEIGEPEAIKGKDGAVTGYRVTFKDADGKEFKQEFTSPDDVLRFGATYVNPDAAFEDWRGRQKAAAEFESGVVKKRTDLGLEREDDAIRQQTGLGKAGGLVDQEKAHKILESDPAYADAPSEQQQSMRDDLISRSQGGRGPAASSGPAAPARPVILDQNTGQSVGGAPAAGEAVVGSHSPTAAAAARPEVTGIGAPVPRPRVQPGPVTSTSEKVRAATEEFRARPKAELQQQITDLAAKASKARGTQKAALTGQLQQLRRRLAEMEAQEKG